MIYPNNLMFQWQLSVPGHDFCNGLRDQHPNYHADDWQNQFVLELVGANGHFHGGQRMSVMAPNFALLAVSRVVTALVSGVAISIALSFVSHIAPMAKRGWLLS